MTQLSDFSRDLLESGKFFYQLARKENIDARKQACLRASLYHALAYVEAQVNDIAEHFVDSGSFTSYELGTLLERDVVLERGKFVLRDSLKMTRLTDRIDLLATHFGTDPLALPGYSSLKGAIKKRNSLSHPKMDISLTDIEAATAIEASISVCSGLAKCIFGKDLPYTDRGLDPTSDYA